MLLAVQMVEGSAVMMMIGASPGRVMLRNRWKTSAPSISAA